MNDEEKLLLIGPGVEVEAVVEVVEEVGGQVRHRWPGSVVAVLPDDALEELRARLPSGARIAEPDGEPAGDAAGLEARAHGQPPSADVAGVEALAPGEPLERLALRRRRSAEFAAKQASRPHDREEWGTGDLEAPDAPEPDAPEDGATSMVVEDGPPATLQAGLHQAGGTAATVATARNERLINSVAVGIVLVDGTEEPYRLSLAERVDVVAEVQAGLGWLASQEPDARITWVYDTKVVTADPEPWAGARWPGMPEGFYKGIDAALLREDNGRIYFFRGSQYVRFSSVEGGVDPGYPKAIADGWPGLPAEFAAGIDAALWRQSNGKVYLFKGDRYVRFSDVSSGVDPGYPKAIVDGWPGLPVSFAAGIDAALMRKDNGKIYFFKGDEYVRLSSVASGVDPGYPIKIGGNWKGMPDSFNEGIDAALWRDSNSSIYLFKKGRFYGSYVRFTDVASGMDEGYPKPIGLSTEEAEALWRDPALVELGFPPGASGAQAYVDSLRSAHGTPWGIVAFVTKHPVTWFAYARTPKIVMGHGASGISDRVFAHETGHMFGAPDEYGNSGCSCGKAAGRFFTAPNDNCANCSPDPAVPCIMRSNSSAICAYTPRHLGWHAFLTGIDAALWRDDVDKLYLFSRDQYLRITDVAAGRDEGYPRPILGAWPGLPASFASGIDAALWREDNGAVYFFKGSEYVRFSKVSDGVDAGYPRSIAGSWPGLPASFASGIDAALMRKDNHKIYFFKGRRYVRFSSVADGVDAGYPATIDGNWMPFPR